MDTKTDLETILSAIGKPPSNPTRGLPSLQEDAIVALKRFSASHARLLSALEAMTKAAYRATSYIQAPIIEQAEAAIKLAKGTD